MTAQDFKQLIETEMMRGRLKKLIGEMATTELNLLYAQLIGERLPTAEELVEEVRC